MNTYNHSEIEKKWQDEWERSKLYRVEDSVPGKKNFFALVEFSYPSGNLHVGHWYAFSVPDIYARYKRMKGFNVLYPMGFDAFGLPAENAAIKQGGDPKEITYRQMDVMRGQLRSMGAMFDWSREVVSCDPEYYKWTQWMFNQFVKNDLAYRATTKVNWCPKDMTILANEQVVDGKCERCGTEVEQRDQEQWMLRITKYADPLIDDLDSLNWPHAIKESQKNWIGRSEGSEITFRIKNSPESITVFTTRADTLFGVTYLVLAPENKLLNNLSFDNKDEVARYQENTKKKSELDRQQSKEKTGVELKGIKAINPANGEEVSIFVADYVLAGYGTGAVMAVPAHDERDFEFAKKYDLPIKEVIMPSIVDASNPPRDGKENKNRRMVHAIVYNPFRNQYLTLKWKKLPWHTIVQGGVEEGEDLEEAALREIKEETGYTDLKLKRVLGGPVQARYYADHKDENRTAVSTALYFEMNSDAREEISDEEKDAHEVAWVSLEYLASGKMNNSELPFWVDRLESKQKAYSDTGVLYNSGDFNGLSSEEAKKKITEFVGGKLVKTYRLRDWGISRQRYWGVPIPIVYDPEGNAHTIPDEHLPWLLPTDVDHTPDGTAPLARSRELKERVEKLFGQGWRPEVETMDTFVDSSWYFYRYLDNHNDKEFASVNTRDAWMPIDVYFGGPEHTTMHVLYSRFWVKALRDLGIVKESEAYLMRRNRGLILGTDGNKMSKSKGNVIDPDEIVRRLGADTVRLYLAFMGPYGVVAQYPWDPNGVVGVRRFLERVWRLKEKVSDMASSDETLLHQTIKGIEEDMEEYKFNTAISKMMILLNAWEKKTTVSIFDYQTLLKLLAPFAPHMAEELWYAVGNTESIHRAEWPLYDADKTVSDTITIGVQFMGKSRGEVTIPQGASESEVLALVKSDPQLLARFEGKEPKKVIYVPGRIINIIL